MEHKDLTRLTDGYGNEISPSAFKYKLLVVLLEIRDAIRAK